MNNIRHLRKQIMSLLSQGALNLAAGQSCLFCSAPSTTLCCTDCTQDLTPWPQPACFVCAHPLHQGTCPSCQAHPVQLHHTVAAFLFAHPQTHLIHRFKYTGHYALAEWLTEQLAPAVHLWHQNDPIDALLAMPLHPSRQAERGYNQSHEIAKRLAHELKIPCLTPYCERRYVTRPQVELRLAERRKVPADLFVCHADLQQQHVLLVDDVMTTGSSLNSLAQAIFRQGARQVSAAVIARAALPSHAVSGEPDC